MRAARLMLSLAMVTAAASLAAAQSTLPPPTDPVDVGSSSFSGQPFGTVDFGGRFSSVDGDEARYQRYRDLRSGVFANNGLFARRTEDWTFNAQAWNIGYRDQKYELDFRRVGRLDARFTWDQIPMFISRDTSTLYTVAAPGVFRISDTIQQSIQSGATTLRHWEDQAVRFDMRTMRKTGEMDLVFRASPEVDLLLNVRSTDKSGTIPFGGTFGFSNAVELPAPLDSEATDVRTSLEFANEDGLLSLGWTGSWYETDSEQMIWDNPLRLAPDASGAPTQGRLPFWPSNWLNYAHGTGSYVLPARGRITGYLALGRGGSDEQLMSHTINTAIPTIPLTRETAEAEQQTTVAQVTYSSRPMTALFLSAKYRYSDVDIRTPVFDRLGSVSYDSSPQSSAGPSEYHSARRNTFDVDAAFTVAPRTQVKAGYGFYGGEFTHRIWEQTDENVFRLSVDTTGNEYFTVRALYEDRGRTGDGFRADALAEVGELPSMRHFDIADRDRRRFTLLGTAMPAGTVGLNASIGIGRDEYPDSQHGLQAYDTNQYSVGVDVVPGDRWELNAVFGWEDYASLQQSRNASDAVQQADPLRDWTTDYDGTVRYLDTTLLVREVFTRTNLRLGVEWNRAEDTYLYGIQPGSPIAPPEQLPPVINENTRAEIDLTHQITPRLWFGVTYWFDDYNVEDFALGPDTLSGIAFPPIEGNQPPNTATNSLLLGYLYRPYTAHTGFIRLTYRF